MRKSSEGVVYYLAVITVLVLILVGIQLYRVGNDRPNKIIKQPIPCQRWIKT